VNRGNHGFAPFTDYAKQLAGSSLNAPAAPVPKLPSTGKVRFPSTGWADQLHRRQQIGRSSCGSAQPR
jgi:hypothetical protein